MRSVECDVRRSRDRTALRIPHSALAILAAACTPVTTRPDFAPFPQALVIVIRGAPDRVTAEASAWLAGEAVKVELASPRDGYLETGWREGVKLRCWADPAAPGTTRLTVEAAYRPAEDPSRTERDLEMPVPEGRDGYRLAERLLAAMSDRFGAAP